jgi:hypothetical protein
VDSSGVLGGGVPDGTSVSGDGAGESVVSGLSSDEETVSGDDGVGGERGTLLNETARRQDQERKEQGESSKRTKANQLNRLVQKLARQGKEASETDLEKVDGGSGVNSGGLVDGSNDGTLGVLSRVEGGGEVELEALGELVLELNLSSEEVGSVPNLELNRSRSQKQCQQQLLQRQRRVVELLSSEKNHSASSSQAHPSLPSFDSASSTIPRSFLTQVIGPLQLPTNHSRPASEVTRLFPLSSKTCSLFPTHLPSDSTERRTDLGKSKAPLEVGVLSLEVTVDGVGLGVLESGDSEDDARGSLGLDLELGADQRVVSGEQVRRGLANILHNTRAEGGAREVSMEWRKGNGEGKMEKSTTGLNALATKEERSA